MPLTTIESYLPVSQEYISHWDQVNTALGSPMTLAGGYARADLISDRAAINTAINASATTTNAKQVSGGNVAAGRSQMVVHIKDFRQGVRAKVPSQGYVDALPLVPKSTVNRGAFLKTLRDMKTLWTQINADSTVPGFTPPLVLVSGFTLANFSTALTAFEALLVTDDNNDALARSDRKLRDALLKPMRVHLEQYRIAVPAALGLSHALTLSLPTLYPAPGSTPNPVNASGSWNATTSKADLVWSASDNPNIDHYSIRNAPAPYKAVDESVVADVAKTVLAYSTDFALPVPGASAEYRVYVVLTTSNQKGSNTVRVTRPV